VRPTTAKSVNSVFTTSRMTPRRDAGAREVRDRYTVCGSCSPGTEVGSASRARTPNVRDAGSREVPACPPSHVLADRDLPRPLGPFVPHADRHLDREDPHLEREHVLLIRVAQDVVIIPVRPVIALGRPRVEHTDALVPEIWIPMDRDRGVFHR